MTTLTNSDESPLKVHKTNPFLENIDFITNVVVRNIGKNDEVTDDRVLNIEGKDYQIASYFPEEEYTKIYSRSRIREMILDKQLSRDACKVFLYIVTSISENATSVVLNKSVMIDRLGFKSGKYNIPLRELSNANIIKKKDDKLFWINPMYFFVGKREEYYAHTALFGDLGIPSAKRHAFTDKEITLGQDILTVNKAYTPGKDRLELLKQFSIDRETKDEHDIRNFLGSYNHLLNGINTLVEKRLKAIKEKISKVRKNVKKQPSKINV